MAHSLLPCPSCHRHVRDDDAKCLFCASALSRADASAASSRTTHLAYSLRVTRRQLVAIASTMTLVGCSGTSSPVYGAPFPEDTGGAGDAATDTAPGDSGSSDARDAADGSLDTGSPAGAYGGPPPSDGGPG